MPPREDRIYARARLDPPGAMSPLVDSVVRTMTRTSAHPTEERARAVICAVALWLDDYSKHKQPGARRVGFVRRFIARVVLRSVAAVVHEEAHRR